MAKATAKHITPAAPANPVVELSKSLLTLWNADDGFQAESKHGSASQIKGDTISRLSAWRKAVETMISVTQARNVEGGWYNSPWLLMQWTTYRHRSTRKTEYRLR
jgi:hypothetical protein